MLESIVPNLDYTEWTLALRPGIVFHDGRPADSAALVRHFQEVEAGTLTGIAYAEWEVQNIVVLDDLSIKLVLGRPVTTLPNYLISHLGYLASPAMYDLGADKRPKPDRLWPVHAGRVDPQRGHPVGAQPELLAHRRRGPTRCRTWTPSSSVPFPDTDARLAALRAGGIDASMDDAGINLGDYIEDFKVVRQGEQFRSTGFLMFNSSRPPFDNVEVRRALAQCTDVQTYNTLLWDGQPPATGPFSPGTPGYLEDSRLSRLRSRRRPRCFGAAGGDRGGNGQPSAPRPYCGVRS